MSDQRIEIKNRIWWTIKSRIMAEKRFINYDWHGQFVLLYYSFIGILASAVTMVLGDHNKYSGILWLMFSVFMLCIVTFLNAMNFKQKADIMRKSYIELKKVHESTAEENILSSEYTKVLELYSDNHETIDYRMAISESFYHKDDITKELTPEIKCAIKRYKIWKFLILSLIYILPIAIFILSRMDILNLDKY